MLTLILAAIAVMLAFKPEKKRTNAKRKRKPDNSSTQHTD